MAHVLARHSAETVTGQILFLPLSIALALMFDTSTSLFGQLHKLMVGLPGSRANESEADLIGMHLAARACYAPEGMVNMLQVRNLVLCAFSSCACIFTDLDYISNYYIVLFLLQLGKQCSGAMLTECHVCRNWSDKRNGAAPRGLQRCCERILLSLIHI